MNKKLHWIERQIIYTAVIAVLLFLTYLVYMISGITPENWQFGVSLVLFCLLYDKIAKEAVAWVDEEPKAKQNKDGKRS